MTGIGRYVVEITKHMVVAKSAAGWMMSGPHEGGTPEWLPSGVEHRPLPGPRKGLHLAWTALGMPRIDRLVGEFDLIHALHPSYPIPTHRPGVITIHDLMPVEHPTWYQRDEVWGFKAVLASAAARRWQVIADSEHVATRLRALGTLDPERITVVHLAVGDEFRRGVPDVEIARVAKAHGVRPGKYLLAVGNVSTRKNLEMLVEAFAAADVGDLHLLLAGRLHTSADTVRERVRRLGVSERVLLGEFVPDVDLPALLQGAVALVHPSVDEGFGIPPLEAMAGGTPVLSADAGSLPEIVGEAGVLIDPKDVASWTGAIEAVAGDASLRSRLSVAGRSRARLFTWEKAAEHTLEVHRRALPET